jgi:hypothetical protein
LAVTSIRYAFVQALAVLSRYLFTRLALDRPPLPLLSIFVLAVVEALDSWSCSPPFVVDVIACILPEAGPNV